MKVLRCGRLQRLLCSFGTLDNDDNNFYKTQDGFYDFGSGRVLILKDDDQSSSFVRNLAFFFADENKMSCNVTTLPENRKQSRAHARKSPSRKAHLPVYRG
jgi:hypothetical protein